MIKQINSRSWSFIGNMEIRICGKKKGLQEQNDIQRNNIRNKIGIRCWYPASYSYSWRISESRFYGNGLGVNILFCFCFFCLQFCFSFIPFVNRD